MSFRCERSQKGLCPKGDKGEKERDKRWVVACSYLLFMEELAGNVADLWTFMYGFSEDRVDSLRIQKKNKKRSR